MSKRFGPDLEMVPATTRALQELHSGGVDVHEIDGLALAMHGVQRQPWGHLS
jgi:hypothetical protein